MDPQLLGFSEYLLEYPYADRLYAGALEVFGAPAGCADPVSSSRTVTRSSSRARSRDAGIRDAADDVLVYVHKEEELEDVERRHPAQRYVLVDDKVRILSAVKRQWADRVTTVLPMQGPVRQRPDDRRGASTRPM